jgi:hypothetical protein
MGCRKNGADAVLPLFHVESRAARFMGVGLPGWLRRLFLCSNIGLEIVESVIEAHTGHFRANSASAGTPS